MEISISLPIIIFDYMHCKRDIAQMEGKYLHRRMSINMNKLNTQAPYISIYHSNLILELCL